ncbi:hypothetical protein FQA39_LY09875 [Lamprigera yunnana]|nr:hypothetical protein FQA39_LY09875 [Lamprigera yunnana]
MQVPAPGTQMNNASSDIKDKKQMTNEPFDTDNKADLKNIKDASSKLDKIKNHKVQQSDGDVRVPDASTKNYHQKGRWKSISAKGYYPTIKPFTYNEEMEFVSVGQPILNYKSTTWHPEEKKPMHLESGFLRINPNCPNDVSFMVSHNFGIVSLEEGTLNGNTMNLRSTAISRMHFGKLPAVTEIARSYQFCPDTKRLELIVSMSTTNTPQLTEHLRITYEKLCS